MSSFLCFVCHSTVNADTNEDTREKYREVIGMNLDIDSHLCYICCHFLNKMWMFKSICLKRSLEYPVLFSERGTINLQRSDTSVAILCPEDICIQHLNTKYHFHNNIEYSPSDFDNNNYFELQDERNFNISDDSLLTSELPEEFQTDEYLFPNTENFEDNIFNDELVLPNFEPRVTQNDFVNGEWTNNDPLQTRDKVRNDTIVVELHNYKNEITIEGNIIPTLESTERQIIEVVIDDNLEPNPENNLNEYYIENNPSDNVDNILLYDNVGTNVNENIVNNLNDNIVTTISENILANLDEKMAAANKMINGHDPMNVINNVNANIDTVPVANNVNANIDTVPVANNVNANIDTVPVANNVIDEISSIANIGELFSPGEPLNPLDLEYKKVKKMYKEIVISTDLQRKHKQSLLKKSKESTKVPKEPPKRTRKKDSFTEITLTVKEQKLELEKAKKDKKYVEATFKCHYCAMFFHFKDTYQVHMMRHEESNGEHSCQICSLRFANLKLLKAHLPNHEVRFKCADCSEAVRSRQRSTHAALCEGKERDKTSTCNICGSAFQNQTRLKQHIIRNHQAKASARTHPCNVCGKSFNTRASLRAHMITHINKTFPCDLCNSLFSSPYTLNQHKKMKHTTSYEPEPHCCVPCNLSYSSRKSLMAHMRNSIAHKDTVYKCDLCQKIFPTLRNLDAHKNTIHIRNNRIYMCDLCPCKYACKKTLVTHMVKHRPEYRKPKRLCHLCGTAFRTKSILTRHLLKVCGKEKPEEMPTYEFPPFE